MKKENPLLKKLNKSLSKQAPKKTAPKAKQQTEIKEKRRVISLSLYDNDFVKLNMIADSLQDSTKARISISEVIRKAIHSYKIK